MTFTRVNEEVAVINGARLVRYGRVDRFDPLSVTLTDGTRWRQVDGKPWGAGRRTILSGNRLVDASRGRRVEREAKT